MERLPEVRATLALRRWQLRPRPCYPDSAGLHRPSGVPRQTSKRQRQRDKNFHERTSGWVAGAERGDETKAVERLAIAWWWPGSVSAK